MQSNFHQLILLSLMFMLPGAAQAELFMWVDEEGNTHYSDKKPDDEVDARVVAEPANKESAYQQAGTTRPIIRPYEKTARKLHLLDTLYVWKKETEVNRTSKVGVFHTGRGCTTRGAIKTPDVFIHHKTLFPNESNLSYRINRVINGLDYESEKTEKYRLLSRLKKTGGLSLHAEIIDMDFNTCAPNIRKSERLGPIRQIAAHRFTKHRVRLEVSWQLRSNRDQDVVYEAVTEGSFNGWNQSSSAGEAIADALESAVLALFSRREFVDRILVEEEGADPGGFQSTSLQPINSSAQARTRKLYVAVDGRSWINQTPGSTAIGNLLFGDKCAAKLPLSLDDALGQQKWLTANTQTISQAIMQRTRPLGYSVNPASADTLSKLEESGGYSLNAKLIRINYDACAPSLSAATRYKPVDKTTFRHLDRNRVQVWVEWTLNTERNRKLLYRTNTIGFAGSLVSDTRAAEALTEAIGMAAEQLFADRDFIDLITIEAQEVPVDQAFRDDTGSAVRGIVMPSGQEAKSLFIVTESSPWKRLAPDKTIGLYAFGPECSPYKERNWPLALNEYPSIFPDAGELSSATSKVAKSLGYKFQITDEYSVVNLKRKLGGYSLHAVLLDLRFDSCAPELGDDVVYSSRKISPGQFKRHRAIVKIEWRLRGETDQDIRFRTTTEGVADSWLLNSKGKKIMALAVENATTRLFAQAEFVAQLVRQPEQDEGLFSGLFSYFGSKPGPRDSGEASVAQNLGGKFLLQAHAAQVFSEINVLKIGVLEHYVVEGDWPDSLAAIGYSEALFNNSDTIDYVNLQPDGSIVVELKKKFGTDKIIVLSPAVEEGALQMNRWNCSSNLEADYLPVNCETML